MGDDMIAFSKKILKRLVFSFFALYAISLIMNLLGVFIPINIYSLTMGTLFGFPGIITVILTFVFLI